MEKTLEMRVEELERMLFLTKNVLSFDEASTFAGLYPEVCLAVAGGERDSVRKFQIGSGQSSVAL